MKKSHSIFDKCIINVPILILFFGLSIFISYSVNMNTTNNLIKSITLLKYENSKVKSGNSITVQTPENYQNFMTNYYETQANWLIFWLTLLTCLTAIVGIGLPFALGQSYREKIKEMECEFEKKLKDMEFYKKSSAATLTTLKKDVKEIKNQAEQSKQNLQKTLARELSKFRVDMKLAVSEVKKSSILNELGDLSKLRKKYYDCLDYDKEFQTLNSIIILAQESLNLYKDDENFTRKLEYILNDGYYSRGLVYMYRNSQYDAAIGDFIKAQDFNKICYGKNDPTINKCLLKCYIKTKKYKDALNILSEIDDISPRDFSENYLAFLKKDGSQIALELYNKIDAVMLKM